MANYLMRILLIVGPSSFLYFFKIRFLFSLWHLYFYIYSFKYIVQYTVFSDTSSEILLFTNLLAYLFDFYQFLAVS